MKLNDQQKNEIIQFIADNYSGYFISIQLPLALRSQDKDLTEEYFKYILIKFEKHLQGGSENWIKHPYSFIGFYENLFEQGTYHLHILGNFINPLTNERIPLEKMYQAMKKANKHFVKHYKQMHDLEYDIQLARSMYNVSDYCIKELIFKGFVDSDRILISDLLFTRHTTYNNPQKIQVRPKHKIIKHSYERIAIKHTLSIKYPVQMVKNSKYRTFIKTQKHKPSEQELEQKALISSQNKIRIEEYSTKSINY